MSLLEADVNFKVVKEFVDSVRAKAVGQEVLGGVQPGQQIVKIVHDELVSVLGQDAVELNLREKPAVIFLVGLQGAGKTTTAAKLALHIRKTLKKKTGVGACGHLSSGRDRSAQDVGKSERSAGVSHSAGARSGRHSEGGKTVGRTEFVEAVIVDTAGRLQIDEELMAELGRMKAAWGPQRFCWWRTRCWVSNRWPWPRGFMESWGLRASF